MESQIDIGTLLLYFIGFTITIFYIRWIFRIDRILGNSDKQYQLTKLMAEKMGVEKLDIVKIDNIQEYQRLKNIEENE